MVCLGYEKQKWRDYSQIDRIFIIESLITILVSFITFFIIIEFPEKTNIFTLTEKETLLRRLHDDGGETIRDRKKEILLSLRDWKIWAAYAHI